MMNVKNVSVKPIAIGAVTLLPGEIKQVEDTYADAVAFYAGMGYVVQMPAEKKARSKKPPDSENGAEKGDA